MVPSLQYMGIDLKGFWELCLHHLCLTAQENKSGFLPSRLWSPHHLTTDSSQPGHHSLFGERKFPWYLQLFFPLEFTTVLQALPDSYTTVCHLWCVSKSRLFFLADTWCFQIHSYWTSMLNREETILFLKSKFQIDLDPNQQMTNTFCSLKHNWEKNMDFP